MLTRTPGDGRVIDSDSRSVVWQRSKLSFQSPQLTHGAVLPLAGMQDRQVVVKVEETSHEAIEEEQADTNPDPMLDLSRNVQIDKADKDGEGHDVLDNKELIAPTSDGSHRADSDPEQDSPSDNTMLRDRISSNFCANVVVGGPVCKPIAHVNRSGQKEASRGPAMEPIDTLV